ncbi:MAG: GMC family oxidoreductase [Caulobacteraceae bacterium]|nr:GMC family oxidoreductase [Caulobacteraceae bacterium]
MHQTFADVAASGPLTAEVCIIGAGAAGQTLAKALADAGRQVLLVESGGFDYDPGVQALNKAENTGLPYYDLERARLRFFGGTTAIWGGRTCRLDPIDFEAREAIPLSGWPYGSETLAPYYDRAERQLELLSDYHTMHVLDRRASLPRVNRDRIDADYWQFDLHIDRFTASHRREILDHPRIRVITGATVTEVVAAANGRSIAGAAVADLQGRQTRIEARTFVLACGGIENARLMLASRSVLPNGLGNDWVGRAFMEHIHCRGGEIVTDKPIRVLRMGKAFRMRGSRFAAAWRSGDALMRQEGLLNCSFTVNVRRPPGKPLSAFMQGFNYMRHSMAAPSRGWRSVWYAVKHGGTRLQEMVDPWRAYAMTRTSDRRIYAVVRTEQAPNPDSRVTLDPASRDALGMPRGRLHWATSPLDKRSVALTMQALDGELRRLGLGRVELSPWLADPAADWVFDPLISKNPIAGYHHMGTTRMADDPARGATDGDGRVHGIENLYVAGSSLFPTSGWANPTLTIIALALKQADHLAARA